MTASTDISLRQRALALGLNGLLARWDELAHEPWLLTLLDVEEAERQRRSLERRLAAAKLSAMKPIVDFDWKHPKTIDRGLVDELFELQFLVFTLLESSQVERPLPSEALDTGPPFVVSFAESVLQRSLLGHAPPFTV